MTSEKIVRFRLPYLILISTATKGEEAYVIKREVISESMWLIIYHTEQEMMRS